jgi:hypothetical protein
MLKHAGPSRKYSIKNLDLSQQFVTVYTEYLPTFYQFGITPSEAAVLQAGMFPYSHSIFPLHWFLILSILVPGLHKDDNYELDAPRRAQSQRVRTLLRVWYSNRRMLGHVSLFTQATHQTHATLYFGGLYCCGGLYCSLGSNPSCHTTHSTTAFHTSMISLISPWYHPQEGVHTFSRQ